MKTNDRIIDLMKNRKILGIKHLPELKKAAEETILFRLHGGLKVLLTTSRSCCEKVYFAPDAAYLDELKGAKLIDLVFKPVVKVSEEKDYMFIDIVTDRGTYTFTTYNEHNGYYAGITPVLSISEESKINLQ